MDKESPWDYPRPARLEAFAQQIEIIFNGEMTATTFGALPILETSHPRVYYNPPASSDHPIIEMHIYQRCATGFC
jgi:uncharacterized protein (DUF427 family)